MYIRLGAKPMQEKPSGPGSSAIETPDNQTKT